ncbi:Flp pilus assembly protein CpaB [Pseudooceanicola nanhaiensis]|jgi:pilus assembly protein CpaB|uniref:Flp pilus assembly protein CpaB n=1 Tax=Pseudooceanicola nanhaiensis TaxID=375761 RepID=A0A917SXC1_9RHOB|nr:Flp pilus assembly protein CpaB [Pseudooceanicola nanhaiensis]GGM02432.1 Flp pilus assembly protein CpaB [Pseudooceanicola nanhaiensis]
MRSLFGLVLVVGIGLAGFAVYMVNGYMQSYEQQLAMERAQRPEVIPTVEVYVATAPLRYGETLDPEDVRKVAWPENAVPEGSFMDAAVLFPENRPHRFVLRSMEKDEAIMAVKVTEPGEDAGLTNRLERGMRAFAIRVDVASGVSGFLRPSDRVDVYWTGRIASNGGGDVTKLIESGVKLIAVDQTSSMDDAGTTIARTVTVAVNPQQVANLAQAQSTGRLSLSLVGVEDDTVAEAIEVDQNALLGIETPEPKEIIRKEEKQPCAIRTRRGSEVVMIPIPCTD